MAIELTPAAAEELRRILREQCLTGPEVCLRVGLAPRDAGHGFTLDLAQRAEAGDQCFESQGIRVVCPAGDLPRLEGFRVDFREVAGARGFTFIPPERWTSVRREEDVQSCSPPHEAQVREALREVIDPEVGINIVDLGLIYGLVIHERSVRVTMTMTTPACPLGEQIKSDVNARVMERCPGVREVEVEVVWDPPWRPERITEEARKMLGWSR